MQFDMSPFVTTIIVSILAALVVGLSVWLFVLEQRIKKLLAGKEAQSLEGAIGALGGDIRKLETFRDQTLSTLTNHEARIRRSVQGVETIRFNAFKGNGEGGNQSFAIAVLSEEGNGTVLSSLYARDRISVFAKPVKKFVSEHELTEEERDAVTRATPR